VQNDGTILDWLFECLNETLNNTCFSQQESSKPFRNFSLSLHIISKLMRLQTECSVVDDKSNVKNKPLIVHVLNVFKNFFDSLASNVITSVERLSPVLVTFADVIKHFNLSNDEENDELNSTLALIVDRLIQLAVPNADASSINAHLFDKYEIILKCSSILGEYSLK
jgi:hypothetical protein